MSQRYVLSSTYGNIYCESIRGVAWRNPATSANYNLHDGHRTYMLGGSSSICNICHSGTSRSPVYLNSSNGGVTGFPAIACAGCHNGDGLRAHHENSGVYPCYDCHDPGSPPAENDIPPYYFTPDTAHPNKPIDPCNLNGTESRLSPAVGLDNDGNLMYDQDDPACAAALPILSVSPTTLSFGNQAVGTTSAAQTVTMSNTGGAALTVNSITNGNPADFGLAAPATPLTINAGASQTFTLAFHPASSGAKSATISITSDGGNATVSATGTGVAPLLSVSPTTLSFGNQAIGSTSAAQTVTISNIGTGTLNVTGLTSSNAEFAFSPPTISPITPGGSAILSVTFTPTAPAGAKSATISITSDGGNASVSATGTGVAAGALSVSPTTLTYGNQTVGTTSATQTVTMSNTGGTALTVNSITNSNTADFVLAAPATPLTINAGASQTFTVAFSPASSGAKTATISIISTAGNASVSASGTGVTAGDGDVALVKLSVPKTIKARVGRKYEMDVASYATTTVEEIKATVTLTAVYPAGLKVSMEHSSRTKELHADDSEPSKFEFESDLVCLKKGIWTVNWTATISADTNGDPANDVLTGTTQVTCSSGSR